MQMEHLPPHPTKQKYKVVIQGHAEATSNNSFFQTLYQMANFVEIYNAIIFFLQVLILVCELWEMILTWVNKASKDHSWKSVCTIPIVLHKIYDHRCVSVWPKFSTYDTRDIGLSKLKTEIQIRDIFMIIYMC